MSEIHLTGYSDDDGVAISGGGGWLGDSGVAAQLGPEWQAVAAADAEREQRAAAAAEEEKRQEELTKAFLRRRAGEGRSHTQVLLDAQTAFERSERREARREREELIAAGEPIPDRLVPLREQRLTLERQQAEREAAKNAAPATMGDVSKLSHKITQLTSKLHVLGKRL